MEKNAGKLKSRWRAGKKNKNKMDVHEGKGKKTGKDINRCNNN